MSEIRVLVADDHTVVREGLLRVLAVPGFSVVGEAGTGADAVSLAGQLQPDVVVLDISMPQGSGLQVVERIRDAAPRARVLILSVHDETEYVIEAVRIGAHGYVRKDTTPAELREAIRSVHGGSDYFGPQAARHLAAALRGETTPVAPEGARADHGQGPLEDALAVLTSREREVLTHIAQGFTNKQTASSLGISPRTVESHRDSLMRKLGIRTVAGLTRLAMEAGLVSR